MIKSQLKMIDALSTKSQLRFYGADTSTAGILEFIGSSSNGSVGNEIPTMRPCSIPCLNTT